MEHEIRNEVCSIRNVLNKTIRADIMSALELAVND
jgi:hypothetical protein